MIQYNNIHGTYVYFYFLVLTRLFVICYINYFVIYVFICWVYGCLWCNNSSSSNNNIDSNIYNSNNSSSSSILITSITQFIITFFL